MTRFVQTVLDGLANGSVYASVALALVLVHRATHIPNFAQGEMAMVAAFIAWEVQHRGAPWVVALIVSMILSFILGFLIERWIIRWVEGSSPLTLLIITLGLLTILNNGAGWIWGFIPKAAQSPFPIKPIKAGGLVVSWQTIGVVIVLMILMAGVFLLFNYTKLGLGLRAAAGNPNSARLVGINVGMMLAIGWGLSGLVGSAAGIMVAPKIGLDPNLMASVMIFAFTGAVIGGFDSPPGAVSGGLIVGLVQSLTGTYWQPHGNQLSLVLAFFMILLVLIFRPNGLFGRAEVSRV